MQRDDTILHSYQDVALVLEHSVRVRHPMLPPHEEVGCDADLAQRGQAQRRSSVERLGAARPYVSKARATLGLAQGVAGSSAKAKEGKREERRGEEVATGLLELERTVEAFMLKESGVGERV
ncbi:hypothetical protein GUJ93_ZPchr0012g18771 [Zizania palustris]|uniref:Uncharacterized protein n=1 Tax=Zizania palustris TaxID=103762 RepID=A0A8J6BVN9_ZIZPA|nr:hypothetical protein GUJ93_ZPchr0012g18771 [Zizania palustris]